MAALITPIGAQTGAVYTTGINIKKPVFGGACRLCYWGDMAQVTWEACDVPLHPGAARYYRHIGYME